ncbi:MAG: hypothetical protein ABH877_00650 [bacterium]
MKTKTKTIQVRRCGELAAEAVALLACCGIPAVQEWAGRYSAKLPAESAWQLYNRWRHSWPMRVRAAIKTVAWATAAEQTKDWAGEHWVTATEQAVEECFLEAVDAGILMEAS